MPEVLTRAGKQPHLLPYVLLIWFNANGNSCEFCPFPPPPKERVGSQPSLSLAFLLIWYKANRGSWNFVYFSKKVRRAVAFVTIDVDNSFQANGESWGFCPFWKKKKWLAAFVTIYRANLI